MPRLTVKTESTPQRCEICHQSDLFDSEINYCSRCCNQYLKKITQSIINKEQRVYKTNRNILTIISYVVLSIAITFSLSFLLFTTYKVPFAPISERNGKYMDKLGNIYSYDDYKKYKL